MEEEEEEMKWIKEKINKIPRRELMLILLYLG